jgi:hypothetical protein
MIAREIDFSKVEESVDDTSSDVSSNFGEGDRPNMPPFLEICNDSDIATGSGIVFENLSDHSTRLGSIWIYIAKLSSPDLEGK